MTNSCYDISHILERGNEMIVGFRMFEGSYADVTDEDGVTSSQFRREKILLESEVVFNYYGVPESEMHDILKVILVDLTKLPLIPEQR